MSWSRELFLGNWRNKGVALFFAVTIWYFAFQSEKTECVKRLGVELQSSLPENVITRVLVPPSGGNANEMEPKAFENSVAVTFSGPRKQIDRLRNKLETSVGKTVVLSVEPGSEGYEFKKDEFRQDSFLEPFLEGIEITGFDPPTLTVNQEPKTSRTVENLRDRVILTRRSSDFRYIVETLEPAEVTLVGPESFVKETVVSINVDMDFRSEYFDGSVPVQTLVPGADDLGVVGQVNVDPLRVRVKVVAQAVEAQLPVEAMRITFLIPPVKTAIKIIMNDLVGERIPVQFDGPSDQIEQLKKALAQPSELCLGIRVPASSFEQQKQYTFTEDDLELCGSKEAYLFKGIQITQHPVRRQEKRAPWSYTVVPVKEEAK